MTCCTEEGQPTCQAAVRPRAPLSNMERRRRDAEGRKDQVVLFSASYAVRRGREPIHARSDVTGGEDAREEKRDCQDKVMGHGHALPS